jgi:hypothetical protein
VIPRLTSKNTKGRGAGRFSPKLQSKYRSKLEERIGEQVSDAGIEDKYETLKLHYVIPARKAKYTPDFPLGSKPIYIEAKGRFRSADERKKMLLVREQNPDVDIRFVFQKASTPIYTGSPTSHGDWAETHGFQWADKGVIPSHWLEEAKAHE